jgi:cytochrome c-type biogenesis protein CcmH/NrfG
VARAAQNSNDNWTSTQVYVLATICLVIGIGLGYFIQGSKSPASLPQTQVTNETAGSQQPLGPGQIQAPPQQKSPEATAKLVEPMLQQLKANPLDSQLLTQIGNTYYDDGDFPKAIEYYSRALTVNPKDTEVRTDMGTAYFYSGNADKAIEQFTAVLKANPNHANALFNMGIVRWEGKKDPKGAIAAWEDLLKRNPAYPKRQEVQDLIERAKTHGPTG